MSLTVFIDASKFVEIYADAYIKSVATSVETLAAKKVRVDTGFLKNSILNKQVERFNYIIESQAPYALAQEFGLGPRGKPSYRFTPYMMPAVKETEAKMSTLRRVAEGVAKRKSRVNKRYD
jgi:hypothetical protein